MPRTSDVPAPLGPSDTAVIVCTDAVNGIGSPSQPCSPPLCMIPSVLCYPAAPRILTFVCSAEILLYHTLNVSSVLFVSPSAK